MATSSRHTSSSLTRTNNNKALVIIKSDLILLLFTCSIINFSIIASGLDESHTEQAKVQPYTGQSDSFKPTLIGFRCDSAQASGQYSTIESNVAINLTLYGESFTVNTIVAFTTEPSDYIGDEVAKADYAPSFNDDRDQSKELLKRTNAIGSSSERGRKRISMSKGYDCTDFNRVVSYTLTEENILSPHVVTLTVTLPELDSKGDLLYYFCLKQPKRSSSANQTENETFVWVHQGKDWWVTIKVEPSILSTGLDCFLIVLLLVLSAIASGLNLGLMSLDMNELAVISTCGSHQERAYARVIAPLRKRGNYLLCSLLFANVTVNSTLTVILEDMTSGVTAVILSTLAIVILGEIVPQAFCTRQGLAVGAKTVYITYAFMILTFPLSYPISKFLDCLLGEEKGNVYDRERLMEFIKITGHHTNLEADEVAIISGALKLKKIKVDEIMTRIEDVFMLPIDCQLDRETIKKIIEKGYSRIPVYECGDRKQIAALILAKDLALVDPDDHTPLQNMLMYCKHPLVFIEDDATLDVALNEFKTGKSHMAVVRQIYDDGEVDKYYEAIGVVTLEDVIEEVLQVEINDETDTLSDNRRKRRRTEAQVAHQLMDELIGGSMNRNALKPAPSLPELMDTPLRKPGAISPLSSHLTSVSISDLTQSIGGHATPSKSTPDSEKQAQDSIYQSAEQFSPINESIERGVRIRDSSSDNGDTSCNNTTATGSSSAYAMLTRATQFLGDIMR